MSEVSRFIQSINGLYKTCPERRLKTCRWCGVQFSDVTRINLRTTCSYNCERAAGSATRHKNGTYTPTEKQNQARSLQMLYKWENDKEYGERVKSNLIIAYNNPEIKQKISIASKKRNQEFGHWTQTEEGRKKISLKHKGSKRSEQVRINCSLGAQRRVRSNREFHTSANGGTRADLGKYFRSNWEANFTRILNFHHREWLYEEKTFQLSDTLSYTPDFYVSDEDVYYELKGRMNDRSLEQLALMQAKFPDVKIVLIDWQQYEFLRNVYKSLVNWEGK